MNEGVRREVTELLGDVARGDGRATDALLPLVYEELRALAGRFVRPDAPAETLQPTALVHEAFLKLTGGSPADWESRAHFFAVAGRAMRQILANHARGKRALKRGGGMARVTLAGLATPADVTEIDLIALDDALTKLAALSPRQARIVELRFLTGLEEREIAHALGITTRTVRRQWRVARAFLRCELAGESLS